LRNRLRSGSTGKHVHGGASKESEHYSQNEENATSRHVHAPFSWMPDCRGQTGVPIVAIRGVLYDTSSAC